MDEILVHYGIKGQKWGNRRFQNYDGSLTDEGRARYGVGDKKDWKRLKSDAAQDAKDYAEAKAYYGEGAGNRRKLIRNRISERLKDPDYKAEFEKNLRNTDMEKVQQKMINERHNVDRKEAAQKTAKGVAKFLLDIAMPTSLTALAIGTALKATGYDKKIADWGTKAMSDAVKATSDFGKKAVDTIRRATKPRQTVDDYFKNSRVQGKN